MEKKLTKKNALLTDFLYIIILFSLVCENIVSTIFGESLSKIFSLMSCGIILIIILKNRKIKINKFLILVVLMVILRFLIYFVLAPSNLIITSRNSMIMPYGISAYLVLLLFIENNIEQKENLKRIFKCLTIITTISVLLNLFFTGNLQLANNVNTFKEAIGTGYTNSRTWLFGHRNMIFVQHLLWILSTYIFLKLNGSKTEKILNIEMLFTLIVSVISWNSTMMITIIIVWLLLLFRNSVFRKINIIHYMLIYIFLEVGFVFIRIQNIFSNIIVGIFHRNLTFTGRTYIWDAYIKQFNNQNLFNKLIGNRGIPATINNTHNMFLGLLSFTGIVGIMLYIIAFFISYKELRKEKEKDFAKVISIIIFGFLINSITMEFYLQPLFALYIGYKISSFNKLCDK